MEALAVGAVLEEAHRGERTIPAVDAVIVAESLRVGDEGHEALLILSQDLGNRLWIGLIFAYGQVHGDLLQVRVKLENPPIQPQTVLRNDKSLSIMSRDHQA